MATKSLQTKLGNPKTYGLFALTRALEHAATDVNKVGSQPMDLTEPSRA
jgi:hypothetical protein